MTSELFNKKAFSKKSRHEKNCTGNGNHVNGLRVTFSTKWQHKIQKSIYFRTVFEISNKFKRSFGHNNFFCLFIRNYCIQNLFNQRHILATNQTETFIKSYYFARTLSRCEMHGKCFNEQIISA